MLHICLAWLGAPNHAPFLHVKSLCFLSSSSFSSSVWADLPLNLPQRVRHLPIKATICFLLLWQSLHLSVCSSIVLSLLPAFHFSPVRFGERATEREWGKCYICHPSLTDTPRHHTGLWTRGQSILRSCPLPGHQEGSDKARFLNLNLNLTNTSVNFSSHARVFLH